MKKLYKLFLIGTMFFTLSSQAQITINLALANRPQPWLSDWANPVNGQMIITLMGGGAVQVDPNVKLRTTLVDESGLVLAVSNVNAARTYRLKDGINQFSMADALQLQNLMLYGKAKSLLERSGRLPSGLYQLTVEVLNSAGDLIRAKQTRPFMITSYQLPVLIAPANLSALDARIAQQVIVFRWTNLIPASPEIPNYRIQVFEILPNQTPMQAFRGNRPLLDEPVLHGTTQYIWKPMLAMIDNTANSQFIWTVQSLDKNGLPISGLDQTTQGRSEPAIFNIKHL